MTPERRAKLLAMERCPATTENEREICRGLLKKAPCEKCGGFKFYLKTGKCEACSSRKIPSGNTPWGRASQSPQSSSPWARYYSPFEGPPKCPVCGSDLYSTATGSCLDCVRKRHRDDYERGWRERERVAREREAQKETRYQCDVCQRKAHRGGLFYMPEGSSVCGDCLRKINKERFDPPEPVEVKVDWHEAKSKGWVRDFPQEIEEAAAKVKADERVFIEKDCRAPCACGNYFFKTPGVCTDCGLPRSEGLPKNFKFTIDWGGP